MEGAVRHSLTDIEAALVVVDGAKGLGSRDEEALFRATHCGVPVIAALNKIDLAQPEQIRSLSARACRLSRRKPCVPGIGKDRRGAGGPFAYAGGAAAARPGLFSDRRCFGYAGIVPLLRNHP